MCARVARANPETDPLEQGLPTLGTPRRCAPRASLSKSRPPRSGTRIVESRYRPLESRHHVGAPQLAHLLPFSCQPLPKALGPAPTGWLAHSACAHPAKLHTLALSGTPTSTAPRTCGTRRSCRPWRSGGVSPGPDRRRLSRPRWGGRLAATQLHLLCAWLPQIPQPPCAKDATSEVHKWSSQAESWSSCTPGPSI